ncbi:MAG: hypothetical protein ACRDNS_15630 [Trebonia sp.]
MSLSRFEGQTGAHRVLRVHGKGEKIVLAPLPPAIDRAVGGRGAGPVLRCRTGARMDRQAATRRRHLELAADVVQASRRTSRIAPMPRAATA